MMQFQGSQNDKKIAFCPTIRTTPSSPVLPRSPLLKYWCTEIVKRRKYQNGIIASVTKRPPRLFVNDKTDCDEIKERRVCVGENGSLAISTNDKHVSKQREQISPGNWMTPKNPENRFRVLISCPKHSDVIYRLQTHEGYILFLQYPDMCLAELRDFPVSLVEHSDFSQERFFSVNFEVRDELNSKKKVYRSISLSGRQFFFAQEIVSNYLSVS